MRASSGRRGRRGPGQQERNGEDASNDDDQTTCYITPGNMGPMRRLDAAGNLCHRILEVHLTDRERGFGGFYEQLLDI